MDDDQASLRHQKVFFESLGEHYADGYGISIVFLERVKAAVSRFVAGDVLDIGNGGLIGFDPTRARSVAIADLCASSLRVPKTVEAGGVRTLDRAQTARLRRAEANVLALPFRAASFDVVVMCYVAHHLSVPTCAGSRRNVRVALAEVRRVLRPTGTFVLLENCPSLPCKLALDLGFPLWYRALQAFGKPFPFFLSERQIERDLTTTGFTVAERATIRWDERVHQPLFPRLSPPGWLWECLLRNRLFVARPA